MSMTLSVTEDLGAGRLGFLCVGRDVTAAARRPGDPGGGAGEGAHRGRAAARPRPRPRTSSSRRSRTSCARRSPASWATPRCCATARRRALRPTRCRCSRRITRNSQRLLAICNDLLLLSGFESGARSTPHTASTCATASPAAYDRCRRRPAAPAASTCIEPGAAPLEVAGDRGQLDRVVANLLGNALKFTPAGGRVDVRLEPRRPTAVLEVATPASASPPRTTRRSSSDSTAPRRPRAGIPGTGLGTADRRRHRRGARRHDHARLRARPGHDFPGRAAPRRPAAPADAGQGLTRRG